MLKKEKVKHFKAFSGKDRDGSSLFGGECRAEKFLSVLYFSSFDNLTGDSEFPNSSQIAGFWSRWFATAQK